jgi:hypothetical protein
VFRGEFVLSNAAHRPSGPAKQAALHGVALFVAFDLGQPPRVPRCRNLRPGWMSMPEFPVHKNCDSLAAEKKIRPDADYFVFVIKF